ncbi:hypothetical protein RRSWK_03145 [Rhodopirellula sp. SWK7]|nr:hypothetical protein RRSWK_03145 [Rhodopirellula sp. SWK7]
MDDVLFGRICPILNEVLQQYCKKRVTVMADGHVQISKVRERNLLVVVICEITIPTDTFSISF